MKGKVIAFISAPGVGTSFLTKQMASFNCLPGFFEGEEGVFPVDALEVINQEEDTPGRYNWLLERLETILERSHAVARSGVDVYVDGDVLLVEAWKRAEIGEKSLLVLEKWIEKNKHLVADKVLILSASSQKIEENIKSRGRKSEQTEFIKERAFRIGEACQALSKEEKNTRVLDRTKLDFTDRETLVFIEDLIKQIPSR